MAGDRESIKEALVMRFTGGRTSSLRQMKASEYNAMCEAMEVEIKHPGMTVEAYRADLKRLRSAVLHRMQKLGVDTADWGTVDRFCLQPRIAGRRFAELDHAALEVMIAKLEALRRKNYSAPRLPKYNLPLFVNPNNLPC